MVALRQPLNPPRLGREVVRVSFSFAGISQHFCVDDPLQGPAYAFSPLGVTTIGTPKGGKD